MTARDELVRDIETTDRLSRHLGLSEGLRRRLIDSRAAMLRKLEALDAQDGAKKPPQRAKVIEFPGNVKMPKKAG
ncbi:MAG: hypothetical protein ACM3JB_01595 [Acidobacteriaceae bacterium]